MTAVPQQAQPAIRRRRPVVHAPLVQLDPPRLVLLAAFFASVVAVVMAAQPMRYVLAPFLAIALMVLLFLISAYRREKTLPVFEVASYWIAAAALYGGFPLLNFMAGGLRWYPLSDNRIWGLDPGPWAVGAFGWRYALHMAAFLIVYLPLRQSAKLPRLDPIGRSRIVATIVGAVLATLFIYAIGHIYGVSYMVSYQDLVQGKVRGFADLGSLPVMQIVSVVTAVRFVLLQIVIALIMLKWRRSIAARIGLIVFLGALGGTIVVMGTARSEFILLLMTTIMFYHRFVRRIPFIIAIPAGVLFLGGFLLMGIMRDFQGVQTVSEYDVPLLASSNEFQAVFATAYDLHVARQTGELQHIPWQIHWSDFYALIPSQILPFEKIDPSAWYLHFRNITGAGFMFGVMSQAVVGWDWLELAIRGALVGLFCAFFQRWYTRHAREFWPTIALTFLSIWMYYSMRQGSFAFLYFIVYRFIPTFLAVETVAWLLRDGRRRFSRKRSATG
ncbi:MAG TPA: hypothetical protein VGF69_07340 [Thermoanaerobaculia bacterium]|jgi:hypothetical protein